MQEPTHFDYIVIGAGASGCVVAARLASNPDVSVLLLEAGDHIDSPSIHNPFSPNPYDARLDTRITRHYPVQAARTELPWSSRRWPRMEMGVVRGGTSAINGCVYVRGHRQNFDDWLARGNAGWGWDDVLPVYKAIEDFQHGASAWHGAGGPLPVRDLVGPSAVASAWTEAAVEAGFDGPNWDYNGARQEDGAGFFHVNVTRDLRRATTAFAYLDAQPPRPNLTERCATVAARIVIDPHTKRASAVECLDRHPADSAGYGAGETYFANEEIIVCAGALESPKLLLLSGLGPAEHLRSHGIEPVVELPGVGGNLSDHLAVTVYNESKVPLEASRWTAEATLFTRTPGCSPRHAPDLQFHVLSKTSYHMDPSFPQNTWIMGPTLLQPASRGQVRLLSQDPRHLPLVQANYLTEPGDVQVLVHGIELAREIAGQPALDEYTKREVMPAGTNRSDLESYVRRAAHTVWHPVGTCKMGRDRLAVVDQDAKVYGIAGLRVADASIMPLNLSGNTHAVAILIGEMVAARVTGARAPAPMRSEALSAR